MRYFLHVLVMFLCIGACSDVEKVPPRELIHADAAQIDDVSEPREKLPEYVNDTVGISETRLDSRDASLLEPDPPEPTLSDVRDDLPGRESFPESTDASFPEPKKEVSPRTEMVVESPFVLDRVPPAKPPFSGTIFVDKDIIKETDPTTFVSLKATGTGTRRMYDRRIARFQNFNATLFLATFSDGLSVEVQVNPEFSQADALKEAQRYLPAIGRLPYALRVDVKTVWIHKGVQPFGGGNRNLLIHTGQGLKYIQQGILEETFVHEAAHTSLDATHAKHPDWLAAQKNDGQFISTYARDNPVREDVAETFLMYLALRYRSNRISSQLKQTLKATIPYRMRYFDKLSLNMLPIK
jgi:hypothetical protein